jgi:hypothetical protein
LIVELVKGLLELVLELEQRLVWVHRLLELELVQSWLIVINLINSLEGQTVVDA